MPVPLDPFLRAKAVRYLLLGWRLQAIADEIHCSLKLIYDIQMNMWRFESSPTRPRLRKTGRPRDITGFFELLHPRAFGPHLPAFELPAVPFRPDPSSPALSASFQPPDAVWRSFVVVEQQEAVNFDV